MNTDFSFVPAFRGLIQDPFVTLELDRLAAQLKIALRGLGQRDVERDLESGVNAAGTLILGSPGSSFLRERDAGPPVGQAAASLVTTGPTVVNNIQQTLVRTVAPKVFVDTTEFSAGNTPAEVQSFLHTLDAGDLDTGKMILMLYRGVIRKNAGTGGSIAVRVSVGGINVVNSATLLSGMGNTVNFRHLELMLLCSKDYAFIRALCNPGGGVAQQTWTTGGDTHFAHNTNMGLSGALAHNVGVFVTFTVADANYTDILISKRLVVIQKFG